MRLNLCSPLIYEDAPGLDPFDCQPPADHNTELLFCFELNREQAQRIDPAADQFWGELVFSGRSAISGNGEKKKETIQLPAGLYLFDQQRSALNRAECTDMAIEQQQNGLWERLQPGNRIYIRRLFEDGSPVTQIFRLLLNHPS
jgi:hypothetical protein